MKRAFTLIEIMICIALMATYLSAHLGIWQSVRRLRAQEDFRWAATSAQKELDWLQTVPYASLPPQVLRVGARGELPLGPLEFDPDSLEARPLQGSFEPIKLLRGTSGGLKLDGKYAHQNVLVSFQFFGQERLEAHRLSGPDQPVPLRDQPVRRVTAVRQARGDEMVPVKAWNFTDDQLFVPGLKAGAVVCVDYLGSGDALRVRGQFLDEQLRPTLTPSPIKLLTITAGYGGGGKVTLQTLRMNQP